MGVSITVPTLLDLCLPPLATLVFTLDRQKTAQAYQQLPGIRQINRFCQFQETCHTGLGTKDLPLLYEEDARMGATLEQISGYLDKQGLMYEIQSEKARILTQVDAEHVEELFDCDSAG